MDSGQYHKLSENCNTFSIICKRFGYFRHTYRLQMLEVQSTFWL